MGGTGERLRWIYYKPLCNNLAAGLQSPCSPERVITLLASNSAGYFMKLVFRHKLTSAFTKLAFNEKI